MQHEARVLASLPQALERAPRDEVVVARKRRQFVDVEQGRVARIAAGPDGEAVARVRGIVGNRDDPFPRVAVGPAEGAELLQVPRADAGLFPQFAERRPPEALVDADEAAGQCPQALERIPAATDEEQLEAAVLDREDGHVHGYGGVRVLVGVWHGAHSVCETSM